MRSLRRNKGWCKKKNMIFQVSVHNSFLYTHMCVLWTETWIIIFFFLHHLLFFLNEQNGGSTIWLDAMELLCKPDFCSTSSHGENYEYEKIKCTLFLDWEKLYDWLIDLSNLYNHLSCQGDSEQYTTKLRTMNKCAKALFSLQ